MPSMLTSMDAPKDRLHNTSYTPEYDGSPRANSVADAQPILFESAQKEYGPMLMLEV
jgi:hypothetical protein